MKGIDLALGLVTTTVYLTIQCIFVGAMMQAHFRSKRRKMFDLIL